MQLRVSLGAKFPNAPKDDILKVVGNLLYYRYMNPCIVAPDGYDIVDFGIEQSLSPDQVNKDFWRAHPFIIFISEWLAVSM